MIAGFQPSVCLGRLAIDQSPHGLVRPAPRGDLSGKSSAVYIDPAPDPAPGRRPTLATPKWLVSPDEAIVVVGLLPVEAAEVLVLKIGPQFEFAAADRNNFRRNLEARRSGRIKSIVSFSLAFLCLGFLKRRKWAV
jgi:hypothetical protein